MKRDGSREGAGASAVPGLRGELEAVLARAGLDAGAVAVFADAVLLAGAATAGRPVAGVEAGFVPFSRPALPEGITRQSDEAGGEEAGSVDGLCAVADRAQTAVEAVNQVIARLERVRLVAVAEGVSAMGRVELARRGVLDVGELSATGRQRWRWRTKARVRQDLTPATGWSRAETATLVGVATAPVAFRTPVNSALSRGTVTWALVRGLWRACDKAKLSAADAAHVASVMLADEAGTCVPERLEADGTVTRAPWGHGVFWAVLEREVGKVAACPDPGDQASVEAAEAARAAREAAYRARSMWVRVNEDGTAQVCFTGTALKVLALGDRLDKAARAARGAGDARSVAQLANDIGIALLGHATIGAHELPDLDIFKSTQPAPEDLVAAGWTPQVIAALSALPPAILQVIVPLLALHDPATAHTLPGVHRTTTTQDPHGHAGQGPDGAYGATGDEGGGAAGESVGPPGEAVGGAAQEASEGSGGTSIEAGHTGAPGCPACLPSVRAARNHDIDHASRAARQDPGEDSAHRECLGEDSARGRDPDRGEDSAHHQGQRRVPRVAWVGRVLGKQPKFLGPDLVRRLALSPGSTFVRLLVDPADGRCLERSTTAYSFDAAMRAQLAAADVTCRAPGCDHHAGSCQVDHVIPHGTGGLTRETNGQVLDTWHHDPKTAKAWDAVLHANRDVTWTTTLSRVYRTRVHDYRELVTLMVDALDRVATVDEDDVADQINREVYQALCYRGAGERLNEGDDDTYDEAHLARFGGDITIGLSHRDPLTGRRTPGPSPTARDRADTAAALARTTPPSTAPGDTRAGDSSGGDTTSGDGVAVQGKTSLGSGQRQPPATSDQDRPRYPGGRRWGLTDRPNRPEQDRQTPWSQRRNDDPPPF
ncbi:HNH endonuclease signature motif containing protein [Ornithinimicrobium sufpigmenti]|uniref:HNH endonuclease signature motif containing protein n=2 Tax=Ornithinimicrobium sufpigmenti TaxID=2508882 RepID=UPI001035A51C|nr:HNH endonuclease signature motif containing protein [Ornithinimicrobium sp. HY006]